MPVRPLELPPRVLHVGAAKPVPRGAVPASRDDWPNWRSSSSSATSPSPRLPTAKLSAPPSGPATPAASPQRRPRLLLAARPCPLARWRLQWPAEMRRGVGAPLGARHAHQERWPARLRRGHNPGGYSPTNCMAARFPDEGLGSRTGEAVRSRSHRTSTPRRFGQRGSAGRGGGAESRVADRDDRRRRAPACRALATRAAARPRTSARASRLERSTARPCKLWTEAFAQARLGPLRHAVRRPKQPRRGRPGPRSPRLPGRRAWARRQRASRSPARCLASPTCRQARPQPRADRPPSRARRPRPPFTAAVGAPHLRPLSRITAATRPIRRRAGNCSQQILRLLPNRIAARTTPSPLPRRCTPLTRS